MRAKNKTFKHNSETYTINTKQMIGDSNYNLRVRIYKGGTCVVGYNAKNNTPIEHLIDAAKLTLDNPSNFVL